MADVNSGERPQVQDDALHAGRRVLAALCTLVIAGAGLAGFWWMQRPTLLQRAERALQEGDALRAKSLLQDHLQHHPADSRAILMLAKSIGETDLQQAIDLLSKVGEADPNYETAVRQVAYLGLTRNLPASAEDALKKLIALDPKDFASRLALAELYFNSRLPADALPHIRACLELRPDRADTYLLYAETLDDLHRPTEMVGPLENAIRLDPDNFSAHANLAYAYKEAGRLGPAQQEAEWCLSRKPDAWTVRTILATVLRDLGEYDQAMEQVQRVLNASPDDLTARLLEADILLFRRQAEEAYSRLKPLYADHAQDRQVLSYLARAAQLTGRTEEARSLREELLKAIPPKTSTGDP